MYVNYSPFSEYSGWRRAGLLGLLLALCLPLAAQTTYTVTSTNDSGTGTLREALTQANSNAGADVINIDAALSGTLTLISSLPEITESVAINGTSGFLIATTVSAFIIRANDVTLSNLAIEGINASNTLQGTGVSVVETTAALITGCKFDGLATGVSSIPDATGSGVSNLMIIDNEFVNINQSGAFDRRAINCEGPSAGLKMSGNTWSNCKTGVRLDGAQGIKISDNSAADVDIVVGAASGLAAISVAIDLRNCDDVVIDNIDFSGSFSLGISANGGSNLQVINSTFNNRRQALRIENMNGTTVTDNSFQAVGFALNIGLVLKSVTGTWTVARNNWTGAQVAFRVEDMNNFSVADAGPANVVIADDDGQATASAFLSLNNCVNATINNVSIVGNTSTGQGLSLTNCNDIAVTGVSFMKRGRALLAIGGSNLTITGTNFNETGTIQGNPSSGLIIDNVSGTIDVQQNTFDGANYSVTVKNMDGLVIDEVAGPNTDIVLEPSSLISTSSNALTLENMTNSTVRNINFNSDASEETTTPLTITGGGNNLVDGVLVAGQYFVGVTVNNSNGNTISCSTISNANATANAGTGSFGVEFDGTSDANTIVNTNFGCVGGFAISNTASGSLTAINNFINDQNGPVLANDFNGSGTITYQPFLPSPPACAPAAPDCAEIPPPCDISISTGNTTVSDEDCLGAGNGSITVSAACVTCENGNSDIRYQLDNGTFGASNSFTGLAAGTYTITVQDVGETTCIAIQTFTVGTVTDVTPPSLNCPTQALVVPNDAGDCGAIVDLTGQATGADNCGGTVTFAYTPASNTFFNVGNTQVSVTASDGTNVSAPCTFTVTVNDAEAPVLDCKTSFDANLGTNGMVTVSVSDLLNGVTTDNCATTFTEAITGGDQTYGCGDVGAAAATLTVTVDDGNGNSAASCDVTINVTDINSVCCDITITSAVPTAENCPGADDGSITVNATCSSCSNGINYSIAGPTPQSNNDGNFTGLAPGDYTVTIADADDNTCSAVSGTVTVGAGSDNTAPTFDCATSLTVTLDLCGEYTLSASEVVTNASDNCGGAVTITPETIALTGAGTADQTFTVSDGTNSAACVVSVTTQENPNVIIITANADDLGSTCPETSINFTAASLLSNDNASDGSNLEVQEVSLSNPADGTLTENNGTYTFTPAAGFTGTVNLSYLVTIEGSGLFFPDNGHFYKYIGSRRSWTSARTAAANSTLFGLTGYLTTVTSQAENDFILTMLMNVEAWIGASDNEVNGTWKWVTGPEAGQVFWQGDQNGGPPASNPTAYNNWAIQPNGTQIAPNDQVNFGQREDYGHFRLDGAWNDYGNNNEAVDGYVVEYGDNNCPQNLTATGNITLEVGDVIAPQASCVANYTVDLAAGATLTIAASDLDNGSSDNCGTPTLSIESGDQFEFSCNDLGNTFELTLIATDGGLTDQCNVSVTIADGNSVCYTCDLGFTVENENTGTPPGIITSRIVCGNDGTITANAFCNGCAAGDLRYSIDGVNGSTTQAGNVFGGLAEGDYTVTIFDVSNPSCTASTSATIGGCVGEIPGNGVDDDCDSTMDELSSVAWILLDVGEGCTSDTDDCAGEFCYGLEYTPTVSGTLTSYTTGFTSTCFGDNTPLIYNESCVMTDNSSDFDACASDNAILFNSSGNNGDVVLTKDQPLILHQICLSIPNEQTLDLVKDAVTDITMSIDVDPVLSTDDVIVATDRPDYVTATVAGNMAPAVSAGTIAACYDDLASAEAAAIAATTATDDFTAVGDLVFAAATVGDCAAVITVTVTDACGILSTSVTYNTRIDADAPTVAGTLAVLTDEGCSAAAVRAAVTTVAALEAMGVEIADNCTSDALLAVTFADAATSTCPVVVTRTYTITDECGKFVTVDQTINVDDTTAPSFTGSLTDQLIEGCDAANAPTAVTTVDDLEALEGNLDVTDACTDDADLRIINVEDVESSSCPLVITRTYTIADDCDNELEVVRIIRITDTTNPIFSGTLNTVTVEGCTGTDAPDPVTTVDDLEALDGDLDVTDNCTTDDTELSIIDVDDAVVTGCPLVVTRTYTIADACGNTVEVVQTINVEDTTDPEASGSLDPITVEGCSAANVPVAATDIAELLALDGDLSLTDGCSPNDLTLVGFVDASTNTCPVVVTRTYTVADVCGNTVAIEQTINVDDTTAPEVTGELTPVVEEGCDISVAPAAVTTVAALEGLLGDLLIEDACTADAALVVTHNDEVGTACPIVITRTYTITDACTNFSEVVHTITIEDTVLPEIGTTGTINACYTTVELAEAAALAAVSVTDNCDASITGVASTVGDCTATITINAQDACGNDADPVTFTTQITGGAVPTEVGGPIATSADIQTTLDNVVPAPPVFQDVCGNTLTPTGGATIGGTYVAGTCAGTITYTYTFTDCAGTSVDWVFTYNVNCEGLKLKVFTEGGLDASGGLLSTLLNENHLLPGQNNQLAGLPTAVQFATTTPAGHPYGVAPWSFTATDGTAYGDFAGQTAYPAHVVDWVLVTVRAGSRTPGADVWTGAGWLHENGEVTFPEGSLANDVTLDAGVTYYIVIEHRNHLPVLATATVQGSGSGLYLEHDFTVADSYAPLFRFGQKEVATGVFAMYAGNADQASSRASINSSDLTAWGVNQTQVGYYPGNFNLNLITNSEDETIWKINQNTTTGIVFD